MGSIPLRGVFKNFNTTEEFRATEPKKELFNALVESVSGLLALSTPAHKGHGRFSNPSPPIRRTSTRSYW